MIRNETGTSFRPPSVFMLLFLWGVIAIVAATTSFIGLGGQSFVQWLTIAGYMFAFFYAWIPISVSIYWLISKLSSRDYPWPTQMIVHVAYLATITIALSFIVHPLTWQDWLYGEHSIGYHSLNSFIYLTVVVCSLMIKYYSLVRSQAEEAHIAARRRIALEHSLDQSRMQALRAQINPHFLFNTLNSIASLVASSSNKEAYKVIELLASLLRNALDFSRESVVTLREELGFLEAYVEIEKVRYGPRLQFSTAVPEDCLDIRVPALSLQPLVENSVKHAVAESTKPVNVGLRVTRDSDTVCIEITDDGPGLTEPVELGVGLSNVKDRLSYLFEDEASFRIDNNALGGVTVTLCLPELPSEVISASDPDSNSAPDSSPSLSPV